MSINASKQDGIGNRTVVCRDTGDLDLSIVSDHDPEIARRNGNSLG